MKFKIIDHFRKSKRTPTDQAVHAADDDDAGQDPVNNLFNSKGAWKVDPNHGLEILPNAPNDFATRNEVMAWVRAYMDTRERYAAAPFDSAVWQRYRWGLADPYQDKFLQQLLPDIPNRTERLKIALVHQRKSLASAKAFHAALDCR